MTSHIENFSAARSSGSDASDAFRADFFHSTLAKAMPVGDSGAATVADVPAPAGVSAAAWSQINNWVASDTPVKFTTAGDNVVPDYILGSDGHLTPNPAKTSPSPDGSISIQVEGNAKAEAHKAAKELEVATIQSQIAYWQRANPGSTDIPGFLKGALHAAQTAASAAPSEAPRAPEQQKPTTQAELPQQEAPRSSPINYGGPGSQSIGNRNIGSAPSGGYRPGSFEPNGPIDRSVVPPPVAGDVAIKGPPSATVEQIQTFLEKLGSPAAKEEGFSQALYDACTNRGLDPAMAVGFFLQESTGGRYGRAHENHSLGNIKGVAPESGGTDGTFRRYNTWAEGARDWARLIDEAYVQKRGMQTLSQVISVYAPGSDNNNERGYVATVKGVVENFKKQNNTATA